MFGSKLPQVARFSVMFLLLLGCVIPATRMVQAAPLNEVEPNNTAQTAQSLSKIGLSSPMRATIGSAGDQDWFAFDVVAERTYVIEVFNLDLALGAIGASCDGNGSSGIGLRIYNSMLTELQESQCRASGAGNVNNIVQFKAGRNDTLLIRASANEATAVGVYSLRVLPRYSEPGAEWDLTTFEPNNDIANAYPILVGQINGLTTSIEERNTSFATNTVDFDWYRFEGREGQSYSVEVFNADLDFAVIGQECDGNGRSGIGLKIV